LSAPGAAEQEVHPAPAGDRVGPSVAFEQVGRAIRRSAGRARPARHGPDLCRSITPPTIAVSPGSASKVSLAAAQIADDRA
jgi:hypothetical protein